MPDGIVLNVRQEQPNGVKKIRLQVIDDKIVRVSATPEEEFSDEKSLIIVPRSGRPAGFSVEEADSMLILRTAALQVHVGRRTGEVAFADENGNPILRENAGGGKRFTPVCIEGTRGYATRQVFESADDDEALYGLGQHQADEFNYKGKNESLFQYNTKVAVPFIVSTGNYGLLWDNYSLGRFGDERDYAQLHENFKLFGADGKEGGITAVYTPARGRKETPPVTRIETAVCYEDTKSVKHLPENFPLLGASVTYSGQIEARESGVHRFHLHYAGYVKVYLDNKPVVPERWRTSWNPNSYKFAVHFEAGRRVPLRIEWKPDGSQSYLGLRALSPVSREEQNKLSISFEMGNEIDYYFIHGRNMDEVIGGYRRLTGKSPVMPKWAMGFWQSREHYRTQGEMLATLKTFRERRIPIDNIVLDWNYWPEDAWGSHEFDGARFPDPKAMVDSIHRMNARMMISVWPKFYTTTQHFKAFEQNGWMYMQAVRDSIRDWVGPGYVGSFYDAYAEGARKLFWQQLKEHLWPMEIDAWWMDASEPNIRDCTDMEYRKQLCGPTALGPSAKFFNAYALMNAQAIYEGLREADPEARVFQLTRSGFAGLQRYSTATWSGDIAARWEDMKAQIPAGLNFAASGIPYWTMDVGGFCVERRYERAQREFNRTGRENADLKEWRELNARWYQFGAFCPLFRAHGQYPFREIYNIAPEGHPAYASILYYIKLRYRMMPYIYSLAGKTYLDDYTIMRPLAMDFGRDTTARNIGDQYLFGPSLMVCPVYEYGARSRNVYFPSGSGWYDFYTGKYIGGGQWQNVEAPYERLPLYCREGSIIPYGPEMQYTDEKQPEEITLYVYTGQDGKFTLYEDEGVNRNYGKGQYATIPMAYSESLRLLLIGDRQGEYPGMLRNRTFNVVVVEKNNPAALDANVKGVKVAYDGKMQAVRLPGREAPRIREDFNAGWEFHSGNSPRRTLQLPHDWSIEGAFSPDNPAGAGGGALPGGIGWYRKTFTVDKQDANKRFLIDFDGVYMNSGFFINGQSLGVRPSGYISFRYDLTPYIKIDAPNVITIKVDNSQQPNSRWYSGSGIYRNVWLTKVDPVHVDLWGTYIVTPRVTTRRALIEVRTTVANSGKVAAGAKLTSTLLDANGNRQGSVTSTLNLNAGAKREASQQIMLDNPVRWSVEAPYLYTIRTEIRVGNRLTDSYDTPFGIRTFRFDAAQGFFLNERPVKIKGVCMHHDLGCLGAAFNRRAAERQLELLREMGCNSIRCSHNPPAPELLDLCDRMGFIVMDEAFDVWRKRKTAYDYSRHFNDWHERDLADLILRDRNHPSVMMWSIGNEVLEQWTHVDADTLTLQEANLILNAGRDDASLRYDGNVNALLTRKLAGIVRSLDPTRPVTAGSNEPKPGNHLFRSNALDIIGYNYNDDWFADVPRNFPGKPFIITESTSALMTRGYYRMPSDSMFIWPERWDKPFHESTLACSSYDNCHVPWGTTHEESWRLAKANDFISGIYVWTGFDYLGEPTPYDFPARSSFFGIVDLAGFPKDVYYMYQSEWSNKPVLHLFPHWNWTSGQTIDMWAYYNRADEVELFINDVSQGVKKKEDGVFHVCWRVVYEPGTVKIVARERGEEVMRKEIHTAGRPARIRLIPDRSAIQADGTDLSFVTVEVADAKGNLCPLADNLINFSVEGNAFIAGVDNGSQTSLESFKAPYRKAFHGKCLVVLRSDGKKGNIRLTASSDGLQSANIRLKAD
jgi:alpha-D-xyloside xylohydrolase